MLIKQHITSLEKLEQCEIIPFLDARVERSGAFVVTDYIGTALDNIDSAKDRIANAIKQLQDVKKGLEQQEEVIKCEVAKWLVNNGIDKIQGDVISSITVFDKAPKQEVIIENEAVIDPIYCKLVADKTAIKEAINSGVDVFGARLEVTHVEQSIKLNKKRVKKVDELGF